MPVKNTKVLVPKDYLRTLIREAVTAIDDPYRGPDTRHLALLERMRAVLDKPVRGRRPSGEPPRKRGAKPKYATDMERKAAQARLRRLRVENNPQHYQEYARKYREANREKINERNRLRRELYRLNKNRSAGTKLA